MKFLSALLLLLALPAFSVGPGAVQGVLGAKAACLEHHSNWSPQHGSINLYKKFNALKGNIADTNAVISAIGGNHPASNPNGTGMSYQDGKIDQAIKLDGVDDHVTVETGINTESTVMSVSLWLRPGDSTNALKVVYLRGSPTNCHYNPSIKLNNSTGDLQWRESGCAGSGTIVTTTISTTAWTHIVTVRNGGTNTLYVNGAAVPTTGAPAGSLDGFYNGAQADIGALFDVDGGNIYADFWNGSVDELAIWSTALTAGDVLKIYDNQKCL